MDEDRVLMKKEEGVDYEVNEMVTGQWSLKKEEFVMTEEVEQVFIEQIQVVEMRETVEEQWSLENGEVVMTEEVEQVWMNKRPVVEVSETASLEKGEVVMTEKVEQVSMDKKQVFEVIEMMEEGWFQGKKEVVMTEYVEPVWKNKKQVVGVSEMAEEQWSLEKGEAVMTEKVEQVSMDKKQVVEVNEMVTGQLSLEKGEVVMTEEAEQVLMDKKQVVEVNEMVAEQWFLEKEDVLEITKTIIDQWLLEKKERVEMADGKDGVSDKSEDRVTKFNGNKIMGKTRERCEALVAYEKAVRKFLTHTTHCSKCVDEIKTDVPHKNTISILFVIGFIVQLVQLFVSSVVNNGSLLRRARFMIKQSYESVVTRAYVFLYKTQGLLSRTWSVLKRSYVRVITMKAYVSVKQTLQRILIIKEQHHASGEVLTTDELTDGVDVDTHDQVVLDQCTPVIVTQPGVTNQGLIRRTWFVVEQSYESVVTGAYVFIIKKPQELLSRTRSVLKQSYLRVVTMKAYVSIKQTLEKILIKQHTNGEVITERLPEEVHDSQDEVSVDQSTPSGVNKHSLIRRTRLVLKQSYESVVTRLYVFLQETQGLLSRTKIVLTRSSVRDVTIKAYISVKQILNRLQIRQQGVVTPSGSNNMPDSNVLVRRRWFFFGVISVLLCLRGTQFMVNQEYHIAVTTKANFFVKQTYDYWFPTDQLNGANVNKVADVEQKDDSRTDDHMVKEVADLVVVEQKDAIQPDDHMVKEVVDLVAIEQNDNNQTDDHVVKEVVTEVVDLVVVEQKDDSQTDDHVVKEVVDLVAIEQNTDDNVVMEVVNDLVAVEQKDDSQTGFHVVKEVVDLVVVEQKDDTDHHAVKEVVDLVAGADQSDGSMVSNEVDDNVVIIEPVVVVQEKDDERLLKTWINYAVTLLQKGLMKRVYFIAGISVLFSVLFCVYIAITKLQRTRINDVVTIVISGVTSGSFFVARINNVVSGVFLWVTVNIIELPRRTLSVLYTRVVTVKEYVVKQTRRTLSVLYTRVVTMKEYVVKQTRDRLNQLVDGQVVSGESIHEEVVSVESIHEEVTSSEHDGLLKPWIVGKEDGKAAAKPSDSKMDAEHAKDHVVTKPEDSKKEHVDAGKEDKTNIRAPITNEGLIRARISYVTTLVLKGHIRTWSTIKQTYHKVFTRKTDGDLVTNQGDNNVVTGPDKNVSGNGRVVITQIKYMISHVLKVHKWFIVEQVYHRVFKKRAQTEVGTSQEHHGNVLTNQEDRRVTMWSLAKQTSYQLVVRTKLRLGSWTAIHVTTRVQTELLRIRSAIKLEKVLNVKVFGQATKKLLHWLRHLVSKEEILKSIVYGGLTEIIASISIVAFFADFDTTILNVIAFALAGLIGGCYFFVTNIWELKKGGGDTYREQLGRVNYFPFHATLAMLSFIIFGMIPPSTFVFSFLKTNDKKIAIWVVSAVSLLCLSLLAIFKAYVTSIKCRFKYVKTVLWYHLIAMGVSICSYLASKMVKGSIDDLGLFDTSTCDAMSRHN